MIVKLLIEHHLECLSLKGGCRGSCESTHVKMPHCWKSHALAHILFSFQINPNSKAYNEGIQVGDYVESINGQSTKGLEHQDAQKMIKAATDELILELQR